MSTNYRLRVIRAEGLQWQPSWHSKAPDPYAEGKLGDATRRTRTIMRNPSSMWDESLVFSCSNNFVILVIEVKDESVRSRDTSIGRVEIQPADLLMKVPLG
ncbi:hypothetical protein ACEPAF_2070 [Sanghuangporus sanghuang]